MKPQDINRITEAIEKQSGENDCVLVKKTSWRSDNKEPYYSLKSIREALETVDLDGDGDDCKNIQRKYLIFFSDWMVKNNKCIIRNPDIDLFLANNTIKLPLPHQLVCEVLEEWETYRLKELPGHLNSGGSIKGLIEKYLQLKIKSK